MTPIRALDALPLNEVPIAVLDFETTGLFAARGDRVVEVAVLRREPQGAVRAFSSLVDPGVPMPESSIAIHGITGAMVAGAPSFEQVLPRVAPLLSDAVLVAHNAPFDLGFLRTECRRLALQAPAIGPVVDTLRVARDFLLLPRCNLQALARRVGWVHGRAHRALADVKATDAVLRAMVDGLDPEQVPSVALLDQRLRLLGRGSAGRRRVALVLRSAAQGHHDVAIDYTSSVDGPLVLRRTVTVGGIAGGVLRGWCHLRNEERRFRVDRIHRAVRVA